MKLFYTLIFLLILSSCATRGLQSSSRYSDIERTLIIENLLIEATTYKIIGNVENAINSYNQVISLDPNNAVAYNALSTLYLSKKDIKFALNYARLAHNNDLNNVDYIRNLGSLFVYTNQIDSAITIYDRLFKIDDSDETKVLLAMLYESANKNIEAIDLYNQVEKNIGIRENIRFSKYNLYIADSLYSDAINEIRDLAIMYPDSSKYLGLIGDVYREEAKYDSALYYYNIVTDIEPYNSIAMFSKAHLYLLSGDTLKAYNSVECILKNDSIDDSFKRSVIIESVVPNGSIFTFSDSILHFTSIIDTSIYDDQIKLAIIDYYYYKQDIEKSLELTNKYKHDKEPVYYLRLDFYSRLLNKMDTALYYNKLAMIKFPEINDFIFNISVIYFLEQDYEQAIVYANKFLNSSSKSHNLESAYTILADAYNFTKNYKKSDQYFDKLLDLNPKNVAALNNYSYYLSLRNEKMSLASIYAQRLLSIEPDNPTYIDTYGWVLFVKGDYKKAKVALKKAVDLSDTPDPDIVLHYIQVLQKLNADTEEIEFYEKLLKTLE